MKFNNEKQEQRRREEIYTNYLRHLACITATKPTLEAVDYMKQQLHDTAQVLRTWGIKEAEIKQAVMKGTK